MKGVVDADTHISEPEAMWKLIDEKMAPRRPVLVGLPEDTWFGDRNVLWLIDGNIFPKPAGKGSYRLVTPSAQKAEKARGDIAIASRELSDVSVRLRDMDRLGVDVQVIYPTLFLVYLTDEAELETALCKAYNSWLGEACHKSNGRLRFVAVLPLRSMPEALEEMKRAKELGAVGIFFRGLEGDKTIDHPYFHPVYEKAAKLDMPICIHTGSGAPWMLPYFEHARNHTFAHGRLLPIIAFRDLVANRIPEKFPGLRIGFIEASAGWAPFLIHILRRLFKDRPKYQNSVELFQDYNLFIACEADEDIPYLAKCIGEDHIVIGSDYGHNDPSAEEKLVETLGAREDVPQALAEKILVHNPRRLYGVQ
jgi:predicted TIM-barrel fold metal-dependent hydrolase